MSTRDRWIRGAIIGVAIVIAVYLLFTVVFPWVELNYITNPVLQ